MSIYDGSRIPSIGDPDMDFLDNMDKNYLKEMWDSITPKVRPLGKPILFGTCGDLNCFGIDAKQLFFNGPCELLEPSDSKIGYFTSKQHEMFTSKQDPLQKEIDEATPDYLRWEERRKAYIEEQASRFGTLGNPTSLRFTTHDTFAEVGIEHSELTSDDVADLIMRLIPAMGFGLINVQESLHERLGEYLLEMEGGPDEEMEKCCEEDKELLIKVNVDIPEDYWYAEHKGQVFEVRAFREGDIVGNWGEGGITGEDIWYLAAPIDTAKSKSWGILNKHCTVL